MKTENHTWKSEKTKLFKSGLILTGILILFIGVAIKNIATPLRLTPAASNSAKNQNDITFKSPLLKHAVKKETQVALSEEKKLRDFDEILSSKNDNDSRLDTEFKDLSPSLKISLENKYHELNRESLNERGMIVFLIGRTLEKSPGHADFEFLKEVLEEAPCQSMTGCSQPSPLASHHMDSVDKITLAYPQIVALKSLENFMSKNPTSPEAKQIIEDASHSKNPVVSQMASTVLKKVLSDQDSNSPKTFS